MKIQLSSYQKLFDSFLLKDFPEIERIEVMEPDFPFSIIMGIKINFYLKPADQIGNMVSYTHLLRKLKERIEELSAYMGEKIVVDMHIYFEGERVAYDIINW